MQHLRNLRAFALALLLLAASALAADIFLLGISTDASVTAFAAPPQPPPISGETAVVLDGDTGDILFEKDAFRRVPPASLTKIVTAIVAIENGRLDDIVPIDFDSYEMVLDEQSSIMGLKPGDTPTLEDLLYGLMLPSGGDAAVAIARHIGGTEEHFVEMMNEKVRDLGLVDTHFVNPHGLDAKDHYSSAYDMAALARYGLRNPVFRSLAATKKYEVKGTRTYDVWNLNRLLYTYDGADGVKIGYTENALETIVASATRNGQRLIVSVMRSNSRFTDAARLMDYYFEALAQGEVTRTPAPTPVPIVTPTPSPTPADGSASDQSNSTAASDSSSLVQHQTNGDIWSSSLDAIGSLVQGILKFVGIGR